MIRVSKKTRGSMQFGPRLNAPTHQADIPMPVIYVREPYRWAYHEVVRSLEADSPLTVQELDDLGAEGWELAGVLNHAAEARYYFKRVTD